MNICLRYSLFKIEIGNFKTDLEYVSTELSTLSKTVDDEKFKAIGQRNQLEREDDNLRQERIILSNQIRDKQKELHRYQAELESLQVIETDQINYLETFETI